MVVELLCCTSCYGSLLEVNPFTSPICHLLIPFPQLSLTLLSQTSHAGVVAAVGEVFHRFATVWASMNATASITNALYSAHIVWRNRGMQVRSLLAPLVEMDGGRHLDESARALVAADISSFAHVSLHDELLA